MVYVDLTKVRSVAEAGSPELCNALFDQGYYLLTVQAVATLTPRKENVTDHYVKRSLVYVLGKDE